MKSNNLKFIVFCVGISVAIASSLVFLLVLCLNINNVETITFEHNPVVAVFEVALLIMGIATCAVASEIYYKYLEFKAKL